MNISPTSLGGVPNAASMASTGAATGNSGVPFAGLVDRFLQDSAATHGTAETAVRDLALGRTDNLHDVLLQVAQADLSFRLVLEIRNRLTEAYQDIIKMQV